MSSFSEIRPISLREQVVEQIRTAIIEGRLKPNDRITETALTEQLGVSRTPVREALILLEREGLVVSAPNKGTFVREFSARDVEEIFTMRSTLENFAATLIMQRLTDTDITTLEDLIQQQKRHIEAGDSKSTRSTDMEFHRYQLRRSEHRLLIRSWTEIVAPIAALLYMRADGIIQFNEMQAITDHTAIVTCYKNKDLPALHALNVQINERVSDECQRAAEILNQRSKQT